MKKFALAFAVGVVLTGCCCMKKPCSAPPPPPSGVPLCGNQSVDPSCTTLIMAAFCQAAASPTWGGCELYPVSRGFDYPASEKGLGLRNIHVTLGASQTCEQACEKLGEAFDGSGSGWQSVTRPAGNALGVADIAALFEPDANHYLVTVGGRPDSGYLESDTPYADWCCCARGCGIPKTSAALRAKKKKR